MVLAKPSNAYMLAFSALHPIMQVRDTRQNAESSRSHQIVRIFVESRPSLPSMPEGDTSFAASCLLSKTSLTIFLLLIIHATPLLYPPPCTFVPLPSGFACHAIGLPWYQ